MVCKKPKNTEISQNSKAIFKIRLKFSSSPTFTNQQIQCATISEEDYYNSKEWYQFRLSIFLGSTFEVK